MRLREIRLRPWTSACMAVPFTSRRAQLARRCSIHTSIAGPSPAVFAPGTMLDSASNSLARSEARSAAFVVATSAAFRLRRASPTLSPALPPLPDWRRRLLRRAPRPPCISSPDGPAPEVPHPPARPRRFACRPGMHRRCGDALSELLHDPDCVRPPVLRERAEALRRMTRHRSARSCVRIRPSRRLSLRCREPSPVPWLLTVRALISSCSALERNTCSTVASSERRRPSSKAILELVSGSEILKPTLLGVRLLAFC